MAEKVLKVLVIASWHIALLIREELSERRVCQAETEIYPGLARDRLASGEKFNLLITGNRIEGENDAGVELIAWAKKRFPEMKAILMSVFAENKEKAFKAGADAFWNTGFDLTELIEIISQLCPA